MGANRESMTREKLTTEKIKTDTQAALNAECAKRVQLERQLADVNKNIDGYVASLKTIELLEKHVEAGEGPAGGE